MKELFCILERWLLRGNRIKDFPKPFWHQLL